MSEVASSYRREHILSGVWHGMPLQEEVAAATATAATAKAEALMKLNPCDRDDSHLGRAFAFLTEGTDCRCCIGARIVLALIVGIGFGALLVRLG